MSEGEWTPQDRAEGCAFCAITHGEAQADVVYADELAVAFLDRRPLFTLARTLSVAVRLAMDGDGSFVAVNNRVSQSVPHLHVHAIPRRKKDGLKGFFWPRHGYSSEEEEVRVRDAIAAALAAPGG